MKVLIAASVCWIVVSLFDRAFLGGRFTDTISHFGYAVASGFGFHFG
jgi:hypothetical protein